ncbi:MAG: pyruvate kinase [Candidatus Binatia bacterium]|nr:pyruvate kinase [Candidatus Binatia bacterium]
MHPRLIEQKTKIVCTIGPATAAEEQLRALILAGMDVARLNFSHGSYPEHGQVIARLRRLADELKVAVAILQDLAGPKVRIGSFATGTVELRVGDRFTLTPRPIVGNQHEVSVSYPLLAREVKAGDTLLLADGAIELEVEQVVGEDIVCRVVVGGVLSGRKGVNCPSGLFGLPIFREKDLDDLRFGVEQGVDYIGVSFVRTVEDMRTARREVERLGGSIPLIAKIETQAALQHFDDILAEADGIMIARGDLSIETPFARVPMVQKQLIAKANRRAKPVITATQMLYSMVDSPRPTRAEVTDVANAVIDGSDAVMLSDETTVGRYPIRAVQTMAEIIAETESAGLRLTTLREEEPESGPLPTEEEALAQVACQLAARLGAEAIVTLTREGATARFVAKYRPVSPILATTPRPDTYRRLALVRGVIPLLLPAATQTTEEMMQAARTVAREYGWQGRKAVFVSNTSVWRGEL